MMRAETERQEQLLLVSARKVLSRLHGVAPARGDLVPELLRQRALARKAEHIAQLQKIRQCYVPDARQAKAQTVALAVLRQIAYAILYG